MHILDRSEEEFSINIRDLFLLLLHKSWIIILCCILILGMFLGYTYCSFTPEYTASITLYVQNYSEDTTGKTISSSDLSAAAKLVDTYAALIATNSFMEQVSEIAAKGSFEGSIFPDVSITSVNSTEVFKVSVSDPNPQKAAVYANAIAQIIPTYVEDIIIGSSVKVVDYASVPYNASKPNFKRAIICGVVLGIFLPCVAIMLWNMFDESICDENDLGYLNLPALGKIPLINGKKLKKQRGIFRLGLRMSPKGTVRKNSCIMSGTTKAEIREAYKFI